jgi:hypothetical protein
VHCSPETIDGVGRDDWNFATSGVPTHKEFALIPVGLLNRGCEPQDIAKILAGTL